MRTSYDQADVGRLIDQLAARIASAFKHAQPLNIIGIRTRGEVLAQRLSANLQKHGFAQIGRGVLDITLYRDDLSTVGAKPVVNRTDLPGDIENRNIVLIDDVLYTGRTIRAALDQLIDFGRPRRVQLAVLIDRGKEHRELPIQADYIGKLVPTKKSEIIKVMLQEFDEEEGVVIVERPSDTA